MGHGGSHVGGSYGGGQWRGRAAARGFGGGKGRTMGAHIAEGDGKELRQLSLEAQVWVRDRYGFVDLEALSTSTTTLNQEVPPLDDGFGANLGT